MRTLESELATTPTDRLLDINLFDLGTADTSFAYHVAKRGVHVRVAAAAAARYWALRPDQLGGCAARDPNPEPAD